MNFMRLLIPVAALCALASPCAEADELRTASYIVQITEHCPEGEVGCRNVSYVGRNIRTGKSISLKGEAVMHLCPDRVTPCSHEGYRFRSGKVEYRVTPDGILLVTRGSEVLVEERGQWQPSPAERVATARVAQSVGVQLDSSYAMARAKLLGTSWKADSAWGQPDDASRPRAYQQYPEVVCGQGYDAVCTGRFKKAGQSILLTIDQNTSTLRVTSVDED